MAADPLYPSHELVGCESGLLLFGAGFMGAHDGVWFREQGLDSIVVDLDADLLAAMAPEFPSDWFFLQADAFDFARFCVLAGLQWNAVSVDPPIALLPRAELMLSVWTALATDLVTLTVRANFVAPKIEGWELAVIERVKGHTRWLVARRQA